MSVAGCQPNRINISADPCGRRPCASSSRSVGDVSVVQSLEGFAASCAPSDFLGDLVVHRTGRRSAGATGTCLVPGLRPVDDVSSGPGRRVRRSVLSRSTAIGEWSWRKLRADGAECGGWQQSASSAWIDDGHGRGDASPPYPASTLSWRTHLDGTVLRSSGSPLRLARFNGRPAPATRAASYMAVGRGQRPAASTSVTPIHFYDRRQPRSEATRALGAGRHHSIPSRIADDPNAWRSVRRYLGPPCIRPTWRVPTRIRPRTIDRRGGSLRAKMFDRHGQRGACLWVHRRRTITFRAGGSCLVTLC